MQKSHQTKIFLTFTKISSCYTHNFINKLNLKRSRLNFFNLPFSNHMHYLNSTNCFLGCFKAIKAKHWLKKCERQTTLRSHFFIDICRNYCSHCKSICHYNNYNFHDIAEHINTLLEFLHIRLVNQKKSAYL